MGKKTKNVAGNEAFCPGCDTSITDRTEALQCDTCEHWYCRECINGAFPGSLPAKLYKKLFHAPEFDWICHSCGDTSLPVQLLQQRDPRIADSAAVLIALGVEPGLFAGAPLPPNSPAPITTTVTTIAPSVTPPHFDHRKSDGLFPPDQREDTAEAQLRFRLQELELETQALKEQLNREPPPSYPFPPVSTFTAPTVFTTTPLFPVQQVVSPVPFSAVTTNAYASVGVTNTTAFSGANFYPSLTSAGGIFSTHPIAVSPPPSAPIFSLRSAGATAFQGAPIFSTTAPGGTFLPHARNAQVGINSAARPFSAQGGNEQTEMDFIPHVQSGLPHIPPITPLPYPAPQDRNLVSLPSLPPPQLPIFDGGSGFEAWWEGFQALVHSKPIDDATKIRYLRQSLTGRAAQKVEGLFLGAHYAEALNTLFRNYGNPAEQRQNLWEELWAIPSVDPRWENLEKFTDTVNSKVIALKRSGVLQQALDESVGLLMKKLPGNLRRKFAEQHLFQAGGLQGSQPLNPTMDHFIAGLTQFRRFAHHLVPQQQQQQQQYTQVQKRENFSNPRRMPESQVRNVPGLYAQKAGNETQPRGKICLFCDKPLHKGQCPVVTSPQERYKIAVKKGRCTRCFSPQHKAMDCRSTKCCYFCGKQNHHSSLCFKSKNEKEAVCRSDKNAQQPPANRPPIRTRPVHLAASGGNGESDPENDRNERVSADPPESEQNFLVGKRNQVIMPIIPGFVVNPATGEKIEVQACLDTGASGTSVTQRIVDEANLAPIGNFKTAMARFADAKAATMTGFSYGFIFEGKNGFRMDMKADAVPNLCPDFDINPVNFSNSIQKVLKHYKVINLPPKKKKKSISLDLLIGGDFFNLIMHAPSGSVICLDGSLRIHETPLGGILSGATTVPKINGTKQVQLFSTNAMLFTKHDMRVSYEQESIGIKGSLDPADLPSIWQLDAVGIGEEPENPMKDHFRSLMSRVSIPDPKNEAKTVQRFQTRLPFNSKQISIGTNFVPALKRLSANLKRLSPSGENTKNLQEYDQIFQTQLKSGTLEDVSPDENAWLVHYLSHFPVFKEDSTFTKVRIVLDPSIKSKNGKCLNDMFYTGPNTMEDLCGLLLRSRTSRFLLISDVAKAFHQVLIDPEDRNALRLLWLKDPTVPKVENNLRILKHAALPFGLKCSPSILGTAINCLLEENKGTVADKFIGRVYMDNCLVSCEEKEECSKIRNESKKIFESAGMTLREWASNNLEFNNSLPPEDKAKVVDLKVLGILWNLEEDSYSLKAPKIVLHSETTKRNILRQSAQTFDPLGFFSPITVGARILLQYLWKLEKDWDQKAPLEIENKWKNIASDLQKISTISVPRKIYEKKEGPAFLVAFCDASTEAYAVVIYLKQGNNVFFVFAKAKVAPLKPLLTVPRLELTAIVCAFRALTFVEKQMEIPIAKKIVYNDSQIALQQIKAKVNKEAWVMRRVHFIQSFQDIETRYLPGSENVSDLATRGITFEELRRSKWFSGPDWLKNQEANWPIWSLPQKDSSETENEEPEAETKSLSFLTKQQNKVLKDSATIGPFGLKDNNFSTLHRLLRVTAWCNRFVKKLAKSPQTENKSFLSASELNEAKKQWCFAVQEEHCFEIRSTLEKEKKNQLIAQLDLFLDEEKMIRCGGRLQNAPFPMEVIHPILLPNKSNFTTLVIRDVHERYFHFKTRQTLSCVRLEFWIPHGISAVNKVLRNCVECRRIVGAPFKPPKMGDLPPQRFGPCPAFENTYLDFAGPISVKTGTEMTKRWIAVFTCMTTRAIHLELVANCTTEATVNALERFFARRGVIKCMFSDNQKSFVEAAKVLNAITSAVRFEEALGNLFAKHNIEWKFIPEASPWYGGVGERMVGLTKSALRKVLWRSSLTEDKFHTLLAKIEATINSRPLTALSNNPQDSGVLTPAHFLSSNNVLSLPPSEENPADPDWEPPSGKKLLANWKKGEKKLSAFWNFFLPKYLELLREQQRLYFQQRKGEVQRAPKEGEVCLVEDENTSRLKWPLCRIKKLHPSHDGYCKYVDISLPSGTTTRRAIRSLIPLETSL